MSELLPVGRVTIAAIVKAVAFEMGLPRVAITGVGRLPALVRARDAVAWLARQLMDRSTTQIGAALGGRDHSTILSAIARAEQRRIGDPAFRMVTDRLRARFQEENCA